MKYIFLFLVCINLSFTASAQFPLGSSRDRIMDYFADNVQYASLQLFKADNGTDALCFYKVRVVGDYTFYFNHDGLCTSYIETYDEKEMPAVIYRFDRRFCRISANKWTGENNAFEITIQYPKYGENFFSIVYRPLIPSHFDTTINSLASN
jgi:hypothetical protein